MLDLLFISVHVIIDLHSPFCVATHIFQKPANNGLDIKILTICTTNLKRTNKQQIQQIKEIIASLIERFAGTVETIGSSY